MSNQPACDLFQRCLRRRSPEDWRLFIDRYEPRLRGLIRRAATRWQTTDHDELLQELYLRMWSASSFRGATENELWAWIRRIAQHTAIDAHKANQRHQGLFERSFELPRLRRIPTTGASPEERLVARERLATFSRTLQILFHRGSISPEDALRIFRWTYLEGYSSLEVARRLHHRLTPISIDQMIYRLRRRLARRGIHLGTRRQG